MPFPHNNNERADLLGVFWADSDSYGIRCDCSNDCYNCGTNVLYYHVYKSDPQQNFSANPSAQKVFGHASRDGKLYVPGFEQATWVLVATWSQMIPFPSAENKYSTEVSKLYIRTSTKPWSIIIE